MTASAETMPRALRIGELAERTQTTPRTIRYYEEIGLLAGTADRGEGKHRVYDEADVDRVREIVRLRDLLGLSLDQLKALIAAETARAELRREWRDTDSDADRWRIIDEALGHIATQLELVRARRIELGRLEQELVARRRTLRAKARKLSGAG